MSIITDFLIKLYKQEGIGTVAVGGMLAKGARDKRRAKQKARRRGPNTVQITMDHVRSYYAKYQNSLVELNKKKKECTKPRCVKKVDKQIKETQRRLDFMKNKYKL